MKAEESILIERLKKGERTAFNELYGIFWAPLGKYAELIVGDENADDVLQEVFVRIWVGRDKLRNDGSLRGYLLRAVYRTALNVLPVSYTHLILAGAIGNMIDSAFYGLIFSASTPTEVAHFGGSYAPLMMGRVVDMFYFPLFQWNGVPGWLSFLVDSRNYFFGAIFNLADAYISVAVVYLLIFQYKFFK